MEKQMSDGELPDRSRPGRLGNADRFLSIRTRVFHDVAAEAARASSLHGNENADGVRLDLLEEMAALKAEVNRLMQAGEQTWAMILSEEHFEAITEPDPQKRRAELLQVAAVAIRWVEAIDRAAGARDPKRKGWLEKAAAKALSGGPLKMAAERLLKFRNGHKRPDSGA